MRIVIAEDDVLLLDDVAGILRRGGHHVVATCASAVEMQAAMLEHRPDVVVFDVHLADGDGIHVFHACDRDGSCAGVAVTGDASLETHQKAMASDVLAYVLKPINPAQLLLDVRLAHANALTRASMRSENAAYQAALEDPKNLILRAKAKLERKPYFFKEDGAHNILRRIALDEKVELHQAAEMIINEEYKIYVTCKKHAKHSSRR